MWHGKRQSAFSRKRLLLASATYPVCSSGFFIATGLVVLPEWEIFVLAGLSVILATVVLLPLIWPSYRITLCGINAFWVIGLLTLIAGVGEWRELVDYLGADALLYIAVTQVLLWPIVGSILLGVTCTAIFKRRLPRLYPPEHCHDCGYDLRHLPHARCPECGTDHRSCGYTVLPLSSRVQRNVLQG